MCTSRLGWCDPPAQGRTERRIGGARQAGREGGKEAGPCLAVCWCPFLLCRCAGGRCAGGTFSHGGLFFDNMLPLLPLLHNAVRAGW